MQSILNRIIQDASDEIIAARPLIRYAEQSVDHH